ncbi:ROK family protein [Paludisphaera mucosa]|uniref:ROK family protein n=1 Tax=Paludisphaera mucosa TaxID=3030827 RepID=A0ABT6F629_9BACT|nr:ROK family protein [Paludisphaera mucosa]MDG3003042.1 ROK family protein [Paludisphaera mucosa]
MNAFDPRPPFYLGIDLGGTNIKSGVVEDTGRPLSSVSIETEADRGPEVGIENLAKAGRLAVEASGLRWDQISGVGLGSPGTMDLSRGMLLQPPNLPGWNQLPIRDLLAAKLDKPTILQNDANAAAYGEYWAGAGRNTRSLVLFTLGTGVGCGIITEGRIIEGRHSHGGECGHIIVQMENGRRCGCGAYGHLEAYASATALVKRAHDLLSEGSMKSVLREIPPDDLTSRAISEAADAGDPAARRLMKETAFYLAVGTVTLLHTIDPDIVLFGGGMIAAGQGFLEDIRQHVQKMAFPAVAKGTRIDYAELGGDAGFIGAAGCARDAFGR